MPAREEYMTKLKEAQSIDLADLLAKYQHDHHLTDNQRDELLTALHQWLVICAMEPDNDYAIFGEVDDLWHEFIVDTRRYMKYCDRIAGRYLHHIPPMIDVGLHFEKGRPPQFERTFDKKAVNRYARLLDRIDEVYGPGNSTIEAWPKISDDIIIFYHTNLGGGGGCGCCHNCT